MYEYKKIVKPTTIEESELNMLGREGWRFMYQQGNCFYFERLLSQELTMAVPVKNDMTKPKQREFKDRK